jgi:hypothetical protein
MLKNLHEELWQYPGGWKTTEDDILMSKHVTLYIYTTSDVVILRSNDKLFKFVMGYNGTNKGCLKKSFTMIFQMLLCGEKRLHLKAYKLSIVTFICKCFRNNRQTAKFGIPL